MKTLISTLHLATLLLIACGITACDIGSNTGCERDADCDSDQICVPYVFIDDDGGTCEDLGDVGDDCHWIDNCRSGLVCLGRSMDEWGALSHGQCALPAEPGEPCVVDEDCRPRTPVSGFEGPAFCDENGPAPVCRENHATPDGGACEGDVECREGSLCPYVEAGSTCVAATGALGSACLGAPDNTDCDPGLFCDGEPVNGGFCRARVAAGGECWGDQCVEGLECNVEHRCQSLPEGAIGCWSDSGCPSDRPTCVETDGLMLCQPAN